jgi:large subunit ribosomal protein L31e
MLGNDLLSPDDDYVTRWKSNEFTKGSYSYHPVGVNDVPALREELARPEGRVFFAGEAPMVEDYGTAYGAHESGAEVAFALRRSGLSSQKKAAEAGKKPEAAAGKPQQQQKTAKKPAATAPKVKKAAGAELKKKKQQGMGLVTREYTINLHRRLFKIAFKKKAPRALKEVKHFAAKAMKTRDVRVDVRLNKFLWSKGIRNVPMRVRVRLTRKRSEEEGSKGKMYTLISWVPVESFKGLVTKSIELAD